MQFDRKKERRHGKNVMLKKGRKKTRVYEKLESINEAFCNDLFKN